MKARLLLVRRVPETQQTVHQTQTETAVTQQKITDYELTMTHQTLQKRGRGGGDKKNNNKKNALIDSPARQHARSH